MVGWNCDESAAVIRAMWVRPCQAPATITIVGVGLGGVAAAMVHCG